MSITHPVTGTDATRPWKLREFVEHAQLIGADFALRVRTGDELRAVLIAIGGHNNYDPDRASALLGPLVGAMSEVRVDHFCGGPALYFVLPFWTHQRIDAGEFGRMGTKYTTGERAAMAQQVMTAGRRLRADEITARQFRGVGAPDDMTVGMPGDDPREVRLWWD